MTRAIAILILVATVLVLQWQINGLDFKHRQQTCQLTTLPNGTLKKATDYQYYECIGR